MKIKSLSVNLNPKMKQGGKLLNCVNMARDSEKKAGIVFCVKKPEKRLANQDFSIPAL